MGKIPTEALMNMNPDDVRRAYAAGEITEALRRNYAIAWLSTWISTEPAPAEIVAWSEVGR